MKPRTSVFLILFLAAPRVLFAQAHESSISDALFSHIENGRTIELFPFLPVINLPAGMTVHQFMLILSVVLIYTVYAIVFRTPTVRPRKTAIALESVLLFVRDDIVYPIMGPERGRRWLSFFSTLFLFLLVVNFLGLIPAFKTATGNINVTSAMALMVFALMIVVGIREIGIGRFFRNFYPEDTALPIGLFVALLEFLGFFIKAIVLSLRIFANMFAGHLAILSFIALIFVLSPFFAVVSIPFALFTYLLEVLVALIQALVFTLLSCIFIAQASSVHGEE